jgi:hypothetical protein
VPRLVTEGASGSLPRGKRKPSGAMPSHPILTSDTAGSVAAVTPAIAEVQFLQGS